VRKETDAWERDVVQRRERGLVQRRWLLQASGRDDWLQHGETTYRETLEAGKPRASARKSSLSERTSCLLASKSFRKSSLVAHSRHLSTLTFQTRVHIASPTQMCGNKETRARGILRAAQVAFVVHAIVTPRSCALHKAVGVIADSRLFKRQAAVGVKAGF